MKTPSSKLEPGSDRALINLVTNVVGAVVFGHLPVGICWLWYTISNGMLGWIDVVLKIGYGVLKYPDSPYPFLEEEFESGGYAKRIRNRNNMSWVRKLNYGGDG